MKTNDFSKLIFLSKELKEIVVRSACVATFALIIFLFILIGLRNIYKI